MTKETLIVGYGITGNNLEKEIKDLEPDIADKKFSGHFKVKARINYDLIFICVDTPYVSSDNPCDLTAIHEVIKEYSTYLKPNGIFVIKSTVLPGTTIELSAKYDYKFVFSPEYYGDTIHCNNYNYDFTIIGGEKENCIKVQQIIQSCYDGRHTFHLTDSRTAELAKYMENCYLAMKVSFCNQFFNIANDNGVNYEELRELFILDPRIGSSHTFVYPDQPYWDSHCLNKDVAALVAAEDAPLLKSLIEFNNNQIKMYKEKR
jgi:nucleotide sugar dehydrogenase